MATKRGAKKAAQPTAAEPIDRLDYICDRIAEGAYMAAIAHDLGITPGSLTLWVQADPKRSVRVRELRSAMAIIHEESAEQGIAQASDAFELARAKELAHHKRWRASKVAPRDYGDKQAPEPEGENSTVNIIGGLPD